MIIDGRGPTEGRPRDCDILIVGAGPAGITLAMELERTGLRIILLETGGIDFDDRAQELNDGTLSGLDTTDLIAGQLRLLGGTSNHWGGHCLPLDPIDFDRRPLSGLTGWPMSYDDMVPAYTRASTYCDVGEFDYSLGCIADRFDLNLLMPEETRVETTVIRQSPPTNFGEKYHDALEASETISLWLWTTVIGIDIDADGQATGIATRNIEGAEGYFTARKIVLACGAIENARLLLANNARIGASFGNQGGYLGACYMDHPVGGAAFLHLDPPVRDKLNWTKGIESRDGVNLHLAWRLSRDTLEGEGLNNAQFYLIPYTANSDALRERRRAREGFANLKSIAKWVVGRNRRDVRLSDAYCSVITNADAMAVHTFEEWTGGESVDRLLLRYETEQLPDRSSYVALGDEVDALGLPKPLLHWSPSLADRDSIVRSAMLFGQFAGEAGIGRVELEDHFDTRYWDATTAWHRMGTTRMSSAPGDGVVGPDFRLHGTKNVFVTGGSVFPSGGRANPTLTIVALSVRLAGQLRAEHGG